MSKPYEAYSGNTAGFINARLAGQWQAASDPYSQTHSWPLHSYGSWTPYGLLPYNNASAFSGAQQANMLAQGNSGGSLMDFTMMPPQMGMHAWGDLGARYPIRYNW